MHKNHIRRGDILSLGLPSWYALPRGRFFHRARSYKMLTHFNARPAGMSAGGAGEANVLHTKKTGSHDGFRFAEFQKNLSIREWQ